MKFWKHSLVAAVAFFGVSSTVLYTSCEQDACIDLRCKNGGSCAEGYCRCPSGFEGAECQIKSTDKFLGRYYGATSCDATPPIIDSVYVYNKPNDSTMLAIVKYRGISDTAYGRVDANTILISDVSENGGVTKYSKFVLNGNKGTYYVERQGAGGSKSVCNFTGTKK